MLSLAISQSSFTAVLLLLVAGRRLEAKSVIVDDSDTSRIIYSSGWSIGNNCTTCFAEPDPTQPSNGTWHDATASALFTPFFTFTFTGTSIEARYIAIDIIQTAFSFTTGTNATYSIDGVQLGTTVRNPANRGAYVYNQSLFSKEGLSNTEHTLRVELLRPSVLLLDYLVYDDGSAVTSSTTTSTTGRISSSASPTPNASSSNPNTNTGAIVGGVVAAVVVLVLCVVLIWYFKHRRREISRRGRPPVLGSGPNSPTLGAYPGPGIATAQGALSSHFYAPSEITSQLASKSLQTGRTPEPPQVVFSHKALYAPDRPGSSLSGTSHIPSETLTSSTTPPAGISTTLSSTPSGPDAQRDSRVNEKSSFGWPRYQVQNPTTPGPPPSSFYSKAVADGEPVEAGMMSRHMSTRSAPPLYSPGGIQRDEDAPPLPEK